MTTKRQEEQALRSHLATHHHGQDYGTNDMLIQRHHEEHVRMGRTGHDELFVVVWSGGYDVPSYVVKRIRSEAFWQAEQWAKDAKEGEDTIDVLRIDTTTLTIERLEK